MSTKQLSLEKPLFIVSLISCMYWTISQSMNVYNYAFAGALYEILWLPMMLMLVGIPVVAAIQLIKKYKSTQIRLYIVSLIVSLITLIFLLFQ